MDLMQVRWLTSNWDNENYCNQEFNLNPFFIIIMYKCRRGHETHRSSHPNMCPVESMDETLHELHNILTSNVKRLYQYLK